jgi:hypothetical protein
MRLFTLALVCVALVGCATPRGPWQWTCVVGAMVGSVAIAVATQGVGPDLPFEACSALPEGQSEQVGAAAAEAPEAICFCPYQEPM